MPPIEYKKPTLLGRLLFVLFPCFVPQESEPAESAEFAYDGSTVYLIRTSTPLAACAPITRACAISAVLDGPLIKQP